MKNYECSCKMDPTDKQKIKITDIVGNIVKADQKSSPTIHATSRLDDDDLVTLNVGGVRHETRIATLMKKPETRLYAVGEAAKASGRKEFYFDRNPQIFPCILNYYRIGKLHMPTDVCGPSAKAELDYWELEDKDIEECCWVNYISYEETMEMLEKFRADERDKFHSVYVPPDATFFAKNKPRLWRALQDPYSSRSALVSYLKFTTHRPRIIYYSEVYTINTTLSSYSHLIYNCYISSTARSRHLPNTVPESISSFNLNTGKLKWHSFICLILSRLTMHTLVCLTVIDTSLSFTVFIK